jgi:hypothetical protein
MALRPIAELINALRGLALPTVPPARIGETAPKQPGDLPAVRVVASELAFSPLGIGGSRNVYLDAGANLVEDRGRRIKGVLNLEVWGGDEDAVNMIALAAAEGLAGIETQLLAKGFLRLRQSKWAAAEEAPLRGTQSDKALKQSLAYEIVFEDVQTAPVGEGIIKEIEVRIKPPVEEGLDIT